MVEVDPEIACVAVTVSARDADRAKALRLLNDRAVVIDGILVAFQAGIDKMEDHRGAGEPQFKSHKP